MIVFDNNFESKYLRRPKIVYSWLNYQEFKQTNTSGSRRKAKYLRERIGLPAGDKVAAQCLALVKAALRSLLLAKGHTVAEVNCIWR